MNRRFHPQYKRIVLGIATSKYLFIFFSEKRKERSLQPYLLYLHKVFQLMSLSHFAARTGSFEYYTVFIYVTLVIYPQRKYLKNFSPA